MSSDSDEALVRDHSVSSRPPRCFYCGSTDDLVLHTGEDAATAVCRECDESVASSTAPPKP